MTATIGATVAEAVWAVTLIPAALLGGLLLSHVIDFGMRVYRWTRTGTWSR